MDLPSTFDVQIDLDVPRTISGHVMFHTRYGQGWAPIRILGLTADNDLSFICCIASL